MVRDLHSQGVPHLAVRVRDGTGLVGPLVIPGVFTAMQVGRLNPKRDVLAHINQAPQEARRVLTEQARQRDEPPQLAAGLMALQAVSHPDLDRRV
jgi:hypothetical protein